MKKLIIMRHGKSSWSNSTLDDFDRPLNERGEHNSAQMGHFLLQKIGIPELILASSAKRTLQTAQIAAKRLGYRSEKIETSKTLYLALPDEIMQNISDINNNINTCLIVGHNPGSTSLINFFGVALDNLPTASAACFEFDTENWKNISPQNARFLWIQMARDL